MSPSFGSVLEVDRRLRQGATTDELWKERAETARAALVAKDADNATLFHMIPAATPASAYEALSKPIWRTDKSKLLLKPSGREPPKSPFETLLLVGVNGRAVTEGYALHAALLAKSRGQQGFVIVPLATVGTLAARILTGNRGAPGCPIRCSTTRTR